MEKNSNPEYEYQLKKDVPLEEQEMLDTTKVILSIIYRDYWATEEQRQVILEKEKYERALEEKEKIEKYGTSIEFQSNKEVIDSNIKQLQEEAEWNEQTQNQMVVYKENKLMTFFRKLLQIFKKK